MGSGSVTPGRVRGSGGLAVVGTILLISGVTSSLVGEALRKDNDATWRMLVLAGGIMAAVGLLCILVLLAVGRARRRTDLSDAELEWGLDSAEDWLVPLRSGRRQPAAGQERPVPDLPGPDFAESALPGQALPEHIDAAYPSPERQPRQPRQLPADNRTHGAGHGNGRPAGGVAAGGPIPGSDSELHPGETPVSSPDAQQPYPPAAQRPYPADPQDIHRPGQQRSDLSPPDSKDARLAYRPGAAPPGAAPPPAAAQPVPPSHPPERPAAGHPPATSQPPERVPNGQSAAPARPLGPQPGRLPIHQPVPAGFPPGHLPGHPAGEGHVPPAPQPRRPLADQPVPPAPQPAGPQPAGPRPAEPRPAEPRPSGPKPAGPEGRNGATNMPPGQVARPRSWFEPTIRKQGVLPPPHDSGPGSAPHPPGAVPTESGAAAPRPAGVQEPPKPGSVTGTETYEQQPPERALPGWTGQDALDDTCPLPVILPGRADVPAAELAAAAETGAGNCSIGSPTTSRSAGWWTTRSGTTSCGG